MEAVKPEKYLEDDDKLHKKLITACDLATEPEPVLEDDEETKSLLRREQFQFS